ncbi:MAG: YcxB family protein [Janthinobacterium lividum]
MEVTYRVMRGDAWRETTHIYTHHPQLYKSLLWPLLLCIAVAVPDLLTHAFLSAFKISLGFMALTLLTTLASAAHSVYKKFPAKNTERIRTDKTGPQGFECLVPEFHHCVAWKNILKIEETAQDFFVFAKGMGYGIPKRAFNNSEQAQQFLQAATTYWKNAKMGLPLSDQQGVWPPAPSVGRRDENAKE